MARQIKVGDIQNLKDKISSLFSDLTKLKRAIDRLYSTSIYDVGLKGYIVSAIQDAEEIIRILKELEK